MFIRQLTFLIAALLVPLTCTLAQSESDTLTITTYYPSPYGIYSTMEVKRGLAVGGGGGAAKVKSLAPGQLYVNNSVILNPLPVTPDDADGTAGQMIYVGGTDKMIKYHDGTRWVNATLTPPPCPDGQSCALPIPPGSTYVTTIWYEQVYDAANRNTLYYWSADYFSTHESHNTPPTCPAGSSPIFSGGVGVGWSCCALCDDYSHHVIVCGN